MTPREKTTFLHKGLSINHHMYSFIVQLGITCTPVWLHDEGMFDILKRRTVSVTTEK